MSDRPAHDDVDPAPHKVHVYAVLRFSSWIEDPTHAVYVREILPTLEGAVAEAERLNRLASARGIDDRYYVQTTRFFPGGRVVPQDDGRSEP